jgi:hypothetical protein
VTRGPAARLLDLYRRAGNSRARAPVAAELGARDGSAPLGSLELARRSPSSAISPRERRAHAGVRALSRESGMRRRPVRGSLAEQDRIEELCDVLAPAGS